MSPSEPVLGDPFRIGQARHSGEAKQVENRNGMLHQLSKLQREIDAAGSDGIQEILSREHVCSSPRFSFHE